MKALVIYESMYGNTAAIAEAIGGGLRAGGVETAVMTVDGADPAMTSEVDLLVIGGPTHVHGMTRTSTREQARKDEQNAYDDPTTGPGLRAWMDELPMGGGRWGAAFDTRMQGPKAFTGSAARGIGRRLAGRGFARAAAPASFLVTKQNTLVPGEPEKARAWGSEIAQTLAVTSNT